MGRTIKVFDICTIFDLRFKNNELKLKTHFKSHAIQFDGELIKYQINFIFPNKKRQKQFSDQIDMCCIKSALPEMVAKIMKAL